MQLHLATVLLRQSLLANITIPRLSNNDVHYTNTRLDYISKISGSTFGVTILKLQTDVAVHVRGRLLITSTKTLRLVEDNPLCLMYNNKMQENMYSVRQNYLFILLFQMLATSWPDDGLIRSKLVSNI